MKYVVLVFHLEKTRKTLELIREFSDYDEAFYFAKGKHDERADNNVSICLYELKDYWE